MSSQYEVLNPWAEVDPVAARRLSPRVAALRGKTIGLYGNFAISPAAAPILAVVEAKLKERFTALKSSWFVGDHNLEVTKTDDKARFEEWVKGIDAAVTAVGD